DFTSKAVALNFPGGEFSNPGTTIFLSILVSWTLIRSGFRSSARAISIFSKYAMSRCFHLVGFENFFFGVILAYKYRYGIPLRFFFLLTTRTELNFLILSTSRHS